MNVLRFSASWLTTPRLPFVGGAVTCIWLLLGSSLASAQLISPQPAAETIPDRLELSGKETPSEQQVLLAFRDQPWLPALQWLAENLKLNLDWQQLPEGEFSLHSSQKFSLEEAEDLINMQLLARGFTLLKRGEVLRVVPLKDVDITLVPHVDPQSLETLKDHGYVRVSFPLQWMIADEAAEEFRPLLSPFGKLSPMRNSNRLEVMDAVINLREMHRLLSKAEADDTRRERVAEFKLQHRMAEEVAQKVRQLLGLPDVPLSAGVQTQLDIEQAKFKAEAVKQMGTGARDLLNEKAPDVFLTVNEKENSILVNAPPNKIEIVRQAIEAIDKPMPETASTWATLSRVKVHEIEGFDPSAITKLLASLQQSGNLSKDARIQHEAAYNRLIAFAAAEDHLTISQVIESFKAKRRSAAVLPLGSINPEYAVKAIHLILKNPQRPSAAPGVASDGNFQCESDPDHRRLLLWASDEEVKEVQNFLILLGNDEQPSNEASSNLQIVNLNGVNLREVAPRLKQLWQELNPSPLMIEEASQTKDSAPTEAEGNSHSNQTPVKPGFEKLVQLVSATDDPEASIKDDAQAHVDDPSPVRIIEGERGEVIILSRNAIAAQSAKKLLEKLVPEPSQVAVITLLYSHATIIKRQLDDILVNRAQAAHASSTSSLATREQPLRIDIDMRTNRLLIQNAKENDLKQLKELVKVLDQPVAKDDRLSRHQRVYRFKYRKAPEVSELVKEVYRDLLSINDRVFASMNGATTGQSYNQNVAATKTNPEYQGLLSVAVDAEANLIVISAPSYLADEIIKMVESLDTQEDGKAVAMLPFTGNSENIINSEKLIRLLNANK